MGVLLFISTRSRDRLRGGSSARSKLPGRGDRPWLTWPVEGVGQLRQQLRPLGLFRRHEQTPAARRGSEPNCALRRALMISSTLRSFGRTSSIIVEPASASASSGRHCGHSGKSACVAVKYTGTVTHFSATASVLRTRNTAQSSDDV